MGEAVGAELALRHDAIEGLVGQNLARPRGKRLDALRPRGLGAGEQDRLVGKAAARSIRSRRAVRPRKRLSSVRARQARAARPAGRSVHRTVSHSATSTPCSSSAARRAGSAPAPQNASVGNSRAPTTRRERNGRSSRASSTTRKGLRSQPGRRTVISGSSPSAVPIPTMIASCRARRTWVRRLAARPVMARRGSCAAARRDSRPPSGRFSASPSAGLR